MNKTIVIVGPTATGKTRIAVNLARRFDAYLLPIDQLQMYKYLEVGINLDYSLFRNLQFFGYQSRDPWHRLTPDNYFKWLSKMLAMLSRKKPVIIEGCSTTFTQALYAQHTNSHIRNMHFIAIQPDDSIKKRILKIRQHYSTERLHAISKEIEKLYFLKLFNESGLKLFRECEQLMTQPDHFHDGLAWALRASACVYYPAYLLYSAKASIKSVRNRIVSNVFNIQCYQNEFFSSSENSSLFFSAHHDKAIISMVESLLYERAA